MPFKAASTPASVHTEQQRNRTELDSISAALDNVERALHQLIESRSRGTVKSVGTSLKTAKFEHKPQHLLGEASGTKHHQIAEQLHDGCAICQTEASVQNSPVLTSCYHVFCEVCMLPWVVSNWSCPNWRSKLQKGDIFLLDALEVEAKKVVDDSTSQSSEQRQR